MIIAEVCLVNNYQGSCLNLNNGDYKVSRPLPYLAVVFAGGILLSGYLILPVGPLLLAAGLVTLAALAALLFTGRYSHLLVLTLCLVVGLAMGRLALEELRSSLPDYAGHYVTVQGVVVREPEVFKDRVNYVLRVQCLTLGEEPPSAGGLLLVRVPGPGEVYGYGSILTAHGVLREPAPPGNPGQFDYGAYLGRRGIEVVLHVEDAARVELLGSGVGNPLVDVALRVKASLVDVSLATLTAEQSAMLGGMMFGQRGELDRGVKDAFTTTGLGHVLCVSGLHVGLILGGFLGLTRLLGLSAATAAPLAALLVVFYAVMTGLGPAVVRAGIMGLLVLLAFLTGRERDWPSALALAALVVLVINPLYIYEAGFQLSFAATWGILYVGPVLNNLLKNLAWLPGWLRALVWVPLGAQLGTLPLVALYFNLVSPVSLMANVLAVPLVGVILLLGIAGSTMGLLLLPLGHVINAGTGTALDLFAWLIRMLADIPGAALYVATPPWPAVVAWYGVLAGLTWLTGRPRAAPEEVVAPVPLPLSTAAAGLITAALLVLVIFWPLPGGDLELHFIDVGQGDAILVTLPGGRNMLVDAGGWPGELEAGEGASDRVVVPYLRHLGVNRLDVLVITHPHEDHAGGVRGVIERIPVGMVVVSPAGRGAEGPQVAPPYTRLLEWLGEGGRTVVAASAGDRLNLDPDVQIQVLAPPVPLLNNTRSDLNNASLVLRLDYGNTSVLLTGDIEAEAQAWLLATGVPLEVDMLKVPHHGSRFSEQNFFTTASPRVAMICVGARNNFGHPDRQVLDLLEEQGALVYRTDLNGAVIVSSNGKDIKIKPVRGKVTTLGNNSTIKPINKRHLESGLKRTCSFITAGFCYDVPFLFGS